MSITLGLTSGISRSVTQGLTAFESSFNPITDIANLRLYVDAQTPTSFTYVSGSGDGDPISQWNDLSGNANHLVAGDTAENFIYKSYGMHGKPAVRKSNLQATLQKVLGIFSGTYTLILFGSVLPERTQSTGVIAGLVNSSALIGVTNDTTLYWFRNQSLATVNYSGTYNVEELNMIVASFENSTTAFIQMNRLAKASFDPNTYDTGSTRLGSTDISTNGPEVEYYGVIGIQGVPSDALLDQIYAWGQARYGNQSAYSVYGLVGDSTIAGQRSLASAPKYNNRNRMYSYNPNMSLQLAVEPAQKITGAFSGLFDPAVEAYGPGFPFADAIAENTDRKPVVVMCGEVGSTTAEWARNASNPTDGTTRYGAALQTLLNAKALGTLNGIILALGINDAIAAVTQATYEINMTNLINNLRSDLDMPTLPIILNSLHAYAAAMAVNCTEAEWDAIRAGQDNLYLNLNNVELVVNDDINGAVGDEYHYTTADTAVVAGRWATAFDSVTFTQSADAIATPAFFKDLVLWADSRNSSSITGGTSVSAWNDLSGNGNHLTQSTADNRPNSTVTQYEGKALVDFDGTNDFLDTGKQTIGSTGLFCDAADRFTVVSIFQCSTGYTLSKASNADPALRTFGIYANVGKVFCFARGSQVEVVSSYTTDEIIAIAARWDGTTLTWYYMNKNGSSWTPVAGTVGTAAIEATNIILGARTSGTGFLLNGACGDQIIYDRALSDTEMTKLGHYVSDFLEQAYDARFLVLGASIMDSAFSGSGGTTTEGLFLTKYNKKVRVFEEAVPATGIDELAANINTYLANYKPRDYPTYVPMHIGGGNVTVTRPYETVSSGTLDGYESNLRYIVGQIKARGFIPVMGDLTFRNYDNNTYLFQQFGSLPYNTNLMRPLAQELTPAYVREDGSPVWELYDLIFNNYATFLSGDGIHPVSAGYTAIQNHLVDGVGSVAFNNVKPASIYVAPTLFDPTTISGLRYWVDASDTASITSVSGGVSQLNDKSGRGFHATQGTSGNRPTTGTETQNGKNLIRFDGTTDFLTLGATANAVMGTTAATLFLLQKLESDGPIADKSSFFYGNSEYSWGTTPGNQDHIVWIDGNIYMGWGSTGRIIAGNPTPNLSRWNIIEVTTASNSYIVRVNNLALYSSGTNTVGWDNVGTAYLGHAAGATPRYFSGLFAESLVYDSVLTSEQKENVHKYLALKWGL